MKSLFLLGLLTLAGCGTRSGGAPAVNRLAHPDPAERLGALAELDQRPDPRARPALLRAALGDPIESVRRDAALVLEQQTRRSLEELALEELRKAPEPELAGWLLRSPREAVRLSAVDALLTLGTPAAAVHLAVRLEAEPSAGVRLLIARALAEAAGRGAGAAHASVMDALRAGVLDPEPAVRRVSARALALNGDRTGVPCLVEALDSASPEERRELVEALRTATGEDLGEDARGWMLRYGNP